MSDRCVVLRAVWTGVTRHPRLIVRRTPRWRGCSGTGLTLSAVPCPDGSGKQGAFDLLRLLARTLPDQREPGRRHTDPQTSREAGLAGNGSAAWSRHGLTAARTHDVIGRAARAEVDLLAGKGYQGAGGTVATAR